ncbi:MAG: hypothetical protein QNM02_00450 [Acidimicrobiia bacterium]|nr:hypothetical protein [Acidimicrobiia bacterium]
MTQPAEVRDWFDDFVVEAEPRLRHALAAALGQDLGLEATSIALAYGWEHRLGSPA